LNANDATSISKSTKNSRIIPRSTVTGAE